MAYFSPEIDAKLEMLGYTIICESPLEVEYVCPDAPQDGVIGFASGACAKELLAGLVDEINKIS